MSEDIPSEPSSEDFVRLGKHLALVTKLLHRQRPRLVSVVLLQNSLSKSMRALLDLQRIVRTVHRPDADPKLTSMEEVITLASKYYGKSLTLRAQQKPESIPEEHKIFDTQGALDVKKMVHVRVHLFSSHTLAQIERLFGGPESPPPNPANITPDDFVERMTADITFRELEIQLCKACIRKRSYRTVGDIIRVLKRGENPVPDMQIVAGLVPLLDTHRPHVSDTVFAPAFEQSVLQSARTNQTLPDHVDVDEALLIENDALDIGDEEDSTSVREESDAGDESGGRTYREYWEQKHPYIVAGLRACRLWWK